MMLLLEAPLEIRATTLARALPLLGERYGRKLRAAPAIAGEIVIARVGDAPFEEVRARLASAFAGEWGVSPDGTLTLAPSAKLRAAEARGWREARLARLRAALAPKRESLAKATPVDADSPRVLREWQARSRMRNGEATAPAPWTGTFLTPIVRLRDTLLTAIPPDELLPEQEQDFGERRVFALDPTPRERALPPSARAEVARYARDAALFDPNAERPGRVSLMVSPNGGLPHVELWIYSRAGRRIAGAFDSLDIYPPEPKLEGEPIPYSLAGYSQEPEIAAFSNEALGRGEALPPAARPFFDVRAREPLSGITSEVLLSAARLAGRSLVVAPDDASLIVEPIPKTGDLRSLPFLAEGEARLEPGWLDVPPGNPSRARARFFPRGDLARGLDILLKTGAEGADLATQTRVVALTPEAGDFLPMSYLLMLAGGAPFVYDLPIRLLAALTPFEREAALSPEGIALGTLNPEARARAERLFYARGLGPLPGVKAPDALLESTVACPNGLPPKGRLKLELATTVSFAMPYEGRVYGSVNLGDLKMRLSGERASRYDTGAIRIVDLEEATVTIVVPPGLEASYQIVGARRTRGGGPYSPTTLPEPYRSELRRGGGS